MVQAEEQIAEQKMPDLNVVDLDGAILQVEGTAHRWAWTSSVSHLPAIRTTVTVEDLAVAPVRQHPPIRRVTPRETGHRADRGESLDFDMCAHLHGKKYTDAARRFDADQLHDTAAALELVKSLASKNFDETVEAGVPPRRGPRQAAG